MSRRVGASQRKLSRFQAVILRKAALVTAGRGWFATNFYGELSTRRQSNDPSPWLGDVNVVVQLSIFIK